MEQNERKRNTGPFLPEVVPTLARQVAALALKGKNQSQIATEMNITRDAVRKFIKHEEAIKFLKEVEDAGKALAKAHVSKACSEMAPEIEKALRLLLKRGSAEGIKIALNVIGVLDQEQNTNKSSILQVYLPGQKAQELKTVDVSVEEG